MKIREVIALHFPCRASTPNLLALSCLQADFNDFSQGCSTHYVNKGERGRVAVKVKAAFFQTIQSPGSRWHPCGFLPKRLGDSCPHSDFHGTVSFDSRLSQLTMSHIRLIAKMSTPETVHHLRPITLCNLTYNLRPFLDSVISPFQSSPGI
jgi:hypothetical protein